VNYSSGAAIVFNNNNLTSFGQDIFQPILNSFVSTSNVISVGNSKTFEFELLIMQTFA